MFQKIKGTQDFLDLTLFNFIIDQAKKRHEIKSCVDSHGMADMIFAIYTMYVIYWLNGFIKTKKECVRRIREVIHLIFDGVGENQTIDRRN